jgi:hypothetical protein
MTIEIVNKQMPDSNREDSFEKFLQEVERSWLESITREAKKKGLSAEAAQRIKELHEEAMKGE